MAWRASTWRWAAEASNGPRWSFRSLPLWHYRWLETVLVIVAEFWQFVVLGWVGRGWGDSCRCGVDVLCWRIEVACVWGWLDGWVDGLQGIPGIPTSGKSLMGVHGGSSSSALLLVHAAVAVGAITIAAAAANPYWFQVRPKSRPRVVGIIPARYKSPRFEGEPLVHISDIPMIQVPYCPKPYLTDPAHPLNEFAAWL